MNEYRIKRDDGVFLVQTRSGCRWWNCWTDVSRRYTITEAETQCVQLRAEEARINAMNTGKVMVKIRPEYVTSLEAKVKKLEADLEAMRKLYE